MKTLLNLMSLKLKGLKRYEILLIAYQTSRKILFEGKESAVGKELMIILVDTRKERASAVQKVLTTWGCLIKTRLGIHDGVLDNCSNR